MNKHARALGKLGGKSTLKKHGKEKMTEWGKLGGRPKKVDCLDETHNIPEHSDWEPGLYQHTCFGCGRIQHFQVSQTPLDIEERLEDIFVEQHPMLLDDMIPDAYQEWRSDLTDKEVEELIK